MKRLFILAPVIAVLVLIISCKDDTVSTNSGNTPADSLLFTKDSIYSGPLGYWGNVFFPIGDTNIKKVKATFDLETNDITDSTVISTFAVIGDSSVAIYFKGNFNIGNKSEILPVFPYPNDTAYVDFEVATPTSGNLYLIMRNIKLYKTH